MKVISPMSRDPVPVVILSFNRPDYLRRVLESVAAQQLDRCDTTFVVHVFQDGAVNRYSGVRHADDVDIARCIALCSEILPGAEIHALPDNVGIAENLLRAQSFVYEVLQAEYAIFLEDDLVLDRRYLFLMERIWSLVRDEPAVGYFSACGNHLMTADEIGAAVARPLKWIPMQHNWAFGLKQQHWIDMRPILEEYYAIVVGRDYRERHHNQIRRLYHARGIPMVPTSQDSATEVATIALSRIKIMLQLPFGRYIGREGLHFNNEVFVTLGYDGELAEIPDVDLRLEPIGQAQIDFIKADYYGWMVKVHAEELANRYGLRLASRDEVTLLYRVLLGREPESEKVYRHAEGRILFADLRNSIINSDEYKEIN